jgi:hypothetical protein
MPTYQLLTDRSLAQSSAITPTTIIHIVTTADTSQSIYGSSYKVELQQLSTIFSGNTNQTKEIFFKGSETNPTYIGNFYAGTCNGGTDPVYIHGSIPNDLSSMISAEVITIPTFSGNVTTDINIEYGPVNSFYSATTITAGPTYSYSIDKFTSLDVLPYMSGITSNNVFGLSVFQNDSNLYVLGMKIKYTSS